MKKMFFLILCFLLAVTVAEAKKNCEVVSGNTKDIGSEIACGDEHFYIIDNDGENIKLLAKYNLYVGLEINQIGPLFDDEWQALNYCNDLEDYDEVAVWPSLSDPGKYYCHTEKELEYDEVRQSSEAVGLTIKDGKYVIRQVGIVYMSDQSFNSTNTNNNSNEIPEDGNIDLKYTEIQEYMDSYLSLLNDEGYNIKDIDLIRLSGFKKLVSAVNGEELDLGLDGYQFDWDDIQWERIGMSEKEPNLLHINIKENIPKEYNWIYSTTYWLGSYLVDNYHHESYDTFMTTIGDLCAVNRGCSGFVKFGAGIRPVLTVAAEDVSYIIKTKTDGNGEIKVSKSASNGGETIKFEITPKKGYVLGEVKVTDSSGKAVVFNDYTFTMPYANVLIEASFLPDNPKTKTFISLFIIVLFVISAILCIKAKEILEYRNKKTE